MEDGLDLDINNYTIKDLERFFQINPNKKYNASDIELKEAELREVLLKTGHIDKKFKRDLIVFLETAKEWLITVNVKVIQKLQPVFKMFLKWRNIQMFQHQETQRLVWMNLCRDRKHLM